MPLREGSSGKLIQGTATGQVLTWDQDAQDWSAQAPSGGGGAIVSQLLWQIDATQSNELVLLAAGHAPGLYALNVACVLDPTSTGTGTDIGGICSHSSAEGSQVVVINSPSWQAIDGLGYPVSLQAALLSDGVSAITLELDRDPGAVGALVNIYASVSLVGVAP